MNYWKTFYILSTVVFKDIKKWLTNNQPNALDYVYINLSIGYDIIKCGKTAKRGLHSTHNFHVIYPYAYMIVFSVIEYI